MDKKKYITRRHDRAQEVRYAHYEGKVGRDAKKKREKKMPHTQIMKKKKKRKKKKKKQRKMMNFRIIMD
mgnify:CR=1 FL=1